jgi:pimeloyl-ACP methyl ester carboxylesterase
MVFPEAVDQQNSAYARFVNKQFARASSDLKRDQHYSLKHRGPIEAPLKELVRYGSIDYAAGNPLINVVFLFPKFGSLESFGNIEDHYSYYKRRLDKFFAIIGTPKKIYLSGHSRGGPIGLHLLSRLQDDPEAKGWSKRIRGFVAFNGALFGSSFTNAYFDPTLPANQIRKQVLALAKLEAKNEVLVSVRNRLQILDNSIPLAAGLVFSKAYEKEDFGISLPDIFTGARIAEDFRKQVGGDRVLGDYAGHIARLKIMATAIDECMRSLTYKVRTKWWETHTLPTNIKYYSFSATMPSPLMKSKPTKWQKSFMKSKMLDGDTVDYKILRGLYYDFYSDRHVSLSDGLIGVHESTFWPKLHQSLNPKQKLYESEILGLFGIHHFALTYARTASDDVDSKHPFPRATFLKTLAQYLEAVDSEK